MTPELHTLVYSLILGLAHLLAYATVIRQQNGATWTAGPRDEPRPPKVLAARLLRAQINFMETWPFFAVAVLLLHVLGKSSAWSLLGCQIYFWCRVAYLPLYAFGVPWVRSIVWAASFAGLLLVVGALLA